ncbi:MAG: protein-L-isoaspartate(D-aspartate) O-methyltransferase [Deltaproteobacteria bacterium]|nr:MAG: protein-L-isoaspartate(D-aspartate) O-methyltransferase [Deltaproteobacteria bacterium]
MDYEKARAKMVETQIRARGVRDKRVLEAMKRIPRHLFLNESLRRQAYDDNALPIEENQTISQPYIVALMTEALELKGTEKVLEIGTGSGYQTAILAELAEWIYSIERIESLADKARKLLERLGYQNVTIKVFDGTQGWEEEGEFDAIIVTAGSPRIPQPLIDQLKVKGRLVIPVGTVYSQDLIKLTKGERGCHQKDMGGCRFVKLLGEHGWKE